MKKIMGVMIILLANHSAYAMEAIAKEDMSPPPAEVAISPEQVPPISSITEQKISEPASLQPAPTGVTTQPPVLTTPPSSTPQANSPISRNDNGWTEGTTAMDNMQTPSHLEASQLDTTSLTTQEENVPQSEILN